MNASNLTLFLDFDGVLHPLWEPASYNDWTLERIHGPKAYAGPYFIHAPLLVELLRPFLADIEIVISSTWGRKRDLATLQGLLPAELAARVKDAVHHHLPPLEAFDQGKDLTSRWAEIAWYREHVHPDIGDRWLATDDDDHGWPDDQRHHLAHCFRDLGDPAAQQAVREGLARFGLDLFYVAKKLRDKEIQGYQDKPHQPNPVMVPARLPGVEVEVVGLDKKKP